MNCLLTGSNGFLGRVINKELSKKCVVVGLSKTSGQIMINLENHVPNFNQQFDLVVHAAGKAHSSQKISNSANDFYKVNVQGTQNLLKGLEKSILPKSFVFISTVAVYRINEGSCINENTPLLAKDAYGQSKILAENIVFDWCTKNNVICTIFRLPLVVGSNPPGNLGAMIKGIRNGYYFNIEGGSAKKSMVLASDVAKYLLKASEIGGIFNLSDGYHPSFFELSENISRQLGKNRAKSLPFWLAKCMARAGDLFGDKAPLNSAKLDKITSDLTFDDSEAREVFGWDPTPVLDGFKISDKN